MSDPVNVTPPMYVPKNKNVLITLAAGSVCDRPVVSSTKKNDHCDITEILLKVALHTIKQTIFFMYCKFHFNTTIYIAGGLIGQ
jgi:hypothetical protein